MVNLKKIYEFSRHFKLIFIVVGAAIVIVSTLFTNKLAKDLALEEQKKIEIWAEATRQLISSDNNSISSDFLLKILDKHDRHSSMKIRCFNFLMNINYNQNINDKKQKQRGDN